MSFLSVLIGLRGETAFAGSLAITSPTSVSLSSISVQNANQTVTGSIVGVSPSDTRGTGAGWTVTISVSNLGINGSSVSVGNSLVNKTTNGSGSTAVSGSLTASGNYDGMNNRASYSGSGAVPAGQFTIGVASVSAGLPATVNITKPDGSTSNGVSVIANQFTVNGLTFTWSASPTYAVSDTWVARVDNMAYTQLTDTPSNLAGVSGANTANMTLGTAAVLTGAGVNSATMITLTAPSNAGMGSYTYNDALSWIFHSNPLVGDYNATVTYTIS